MNRACCVCLAVLALSSAAAARENAPPSWIERKCALYADAWNHATAGRGLDGIGAAFIARHEAFIASGCTGRSDVCPDTARERALADRLTLMAVSEGMAGSFLPFGCPG